MSNEAKFLAHSDIALGHHNYHWTYEFDTNRKKEEKEMKKVYVMCGVPGSGKSTLAKQLAAEFKGSVNIVSRDQIRFSMVSENEPYFSKEKAVFNEFIRQSSESIKKYDLTIIDATHINKASRNKLVNNLFIKEDIELYFVCMKTGLSQCQTWNEARTGRECVPTTVLREMYSMYERPHSDELNNYMDAYSYIVKADTILYVYDNVKDKFRLYGGWW